MKRLLVAMLTLALLTGSALAETKAEQDARMAWWQDARFGMFIHWGLYAVPAGQWHASTNHAEWIRTTAQIPIDEYDKFVDQFNPVKFDADAWVRLAKEAGMKYIVITSKHHDGFCLWDFKVSNFDVMSTPYRRDILKQLAEACRRHGMPMCWYHSIMDWPTDATLVVPGIGNAVRQAYLLADPGKDLHVKRTGTDLRVHLPEHAPDAICSVVALKIQGRPVIYEVPQIVATSDRLVHWLPVELKTRSPDLVIRYTLDGSEPTSTSPRYEQPIRLTRTTTVKTRAFHHGKPVSSVTSQKFTQVDAVPAIKVAGATAGLKCEIYHGDWNVVPE